MLLAAEQLGIEYIHSFFANTQNYDNKPDTCNASTQVESDIILPIEVGQSAYDVTAKNRPSVVDAMVQTQDKPTSSSEQKDIPIKSEISEKVDNSNKTPPHFSELPSVLKVDESPASKTSTFAVITKDEEDTPPTELNVLTNSSQKNAESINNLTPRSTRKRKKTALILEYEKGRKKQNINKGKQTNRTDNSIVNETIPEKNIFHKSNDELKSLSESNSLTENSVDELKSVVDEKTIIKHRTTKKKRNVDLSPTIVKIEPVDDYELKEPVEKSVSLDTSMSDGEVSDFAAVTDAVESFLVNQLAPREKITIENNEIKSVESKLETDENKLNDLSAPKRRKRKKNVDGPEKKNVVRCKTKPEDLICKHCGYRFKYKSALKIHELRHSKIKPYQCDVCSKAYYIQSDLITHKRVHTGERPFQCQYCGQDFYDSAAFRNHEKRHVKKSQEPMFICGADNCKMEFPKETQKIKHEVTAHQMDHEKFKCGVCKKVFFVKSEWERHMLCHKKGYSCPVCKKTFQRKENLAMHAVTHTGERPYKCKSCDRAYSSSISLKSHEVRHQSEQQFTCEFCPKKFWRRFERDLHERTHTNVKPYTCLHCGKSYKCISHLRVHERVHTGVRPYKCDVCHATFSAPNTLSRHKVIHSSDRPFVCRCGKTFRRKSHLVVHQRTHAGHADDIVEENVVDVQTVNISSLSELQELAGSDIKLEGITMEELEDSPIYIQIINDPQ